MTKEVDDQGDVHVPVQVNEGSGDVQDLVAEEVSAVLVQMGEDDDMTYVVEHIGAVNFQVPRDDGGGAAKVPEGADTAPVDEGDTVYVQTPVDEEGGAA